MKGKKGTHDRGMPWWRQGTDEVLNDFKLRSCFPKGKWLEGLGFYITLKALVSKQYEEGDEECTTFTISISYLIGLCENSITPKIAKQYLKSMLEKDVVNNLIVEEDTYTITINRIYDEIDEYRRQIRNKINKLETHEKLTNTEHNITKQNIHNTNNLVKEDNSSKRIGEVMLNINGEDVPFSEYKNHMDKEINSH
jgi:hypothetical protein